MQRKDPFKVVWVVFSIVSVLAIAFLPGLIQDCSGHRRSNPAGMVPSGMAGLRLDDLHPPVRSYRE